MLSLYLYLKVFVGALFSHTYVYATHICPLVLFYPVGLWLSTLILYWVAYMLIQISFIFKVYYKTLLYLCFTFKLQCLIPGNQVVNSIISFYKVITNLCYFFSNYIYVFHVKKFEFYLFLIFIVCFLAF